MIQKGSQVSIHYTLTVDGKVIDSSVGKQPLTYVQGSGQIIPGLDEEMLGMKAGMKKHVKVPPEKGYGLVDPEAIQKVPKSSFQDAKALKVGMTVNGQSGDHPMQAKVTAISSKYVTLNLNHPLAGKTLNFDVEVVEVAAAKK